MTTDLPLKIDERRTVSISLAVLIGLLSAVASAAVVWNGDRLVLAAHSLQLSEHAQRLRKIEESQVKLDIISERVDWIRRRMEEQRRYEGP